MVITGLDVVGMEEQTPSLVKMSPDEARELAQTLLDAAREAEAESRLLSRVLRGRCRRRTSKLFKRAVDTFNRRDLEANLAELDPEVTGP